MKKKYLTKKEFRYYTNPKHLDKYGNPHPAYISLKYGNAYKFNVITHSVDFFGDDTIPLVKNPNCNNNSNNSNASRISTPRWENKRSFSNYKLFGWRFVKADKKTIKKLNRKHK